jgi:hypothetical protein
MQLLQKLREHNSKMTENNSKRLGIGIALRLEFPAYYPPGRHHYNAFAT